jgi:hypothetical protein
LHTESCGINICSTFPESSSADIYLSLLENFGTDILQPFLAARHGFLLNDDGSSEEMLERKDGLLGREEGSLVEAADGLLGTEDESSFGTEVGCLFETEDGLLKTGDGLLETEGEGWFETEGESLVETEDESLSGTEGEGLVKEGDGLFTIKVGLTEEERDEDDEE